MSLTFDDTAFLRMLDVTEKNVRRAVRNGLGDAADALLHDSRNLAPLDKGTLRSTAWSGVDEEGTEITGVVTYSVTEQSASGERFNYALYQHELGESYADPTTPGTQPKFLERPLKQNYDRYMRIATDQIRKELT
ncbi:hypothetical protein [Paenibacillus sp. YN15]|uniref:hypothetical protein n=1 Tax=Paenibacillus sp. YN15 TaxID=1742774 RepID=UPI000DCD7CBD|nr:hypothetical protein [Paenibacillus sp. YN15]RAU96838.1 hypothetical protein DQG13_19995 [Paenibacillus sp. YN15]